MNTTSTNESATTLQPEMTPERMAELRANLNNAGPDHAFLRIMALNFPEFVAYIGPKQAKEWEDSYDATYVAERYEWASRLIVIIIDLDLHRQQLPPALFHAFEAAWTRAYGDGDHGTPSELEWRAGIVQMLGIL